MRPGCYSSISAALATPRKPFKLEPHTHARPDMYAMFHGGQTYSEKAFTLAPSLCKRCQQSLSHFDHLRRQNPKWSMSKLSSPEIEKLVHIHNGLFSGYLLFKPTFIKHCLHVCHTPWVMKRITPSQNSHSLKRCF